ncbi:hypothetical protein HCN44_002763 [Aphidius gifuensis]|uniref:GP-PDE domain-containing protein n=1 Tax=Aphidius gifuensis TaxID=684658 RepID=A0A834XUV1_APHGI|nr:hypothetical protein HCN44_002763 [Aphidius gifuensis]
MSGFLYCLLNCSLLWIYLETILFILISILYYFSIPWIVWGTLLLLIIMWILKNAQPDKKIVNEILGIDPCLINNNSNDNLINNNQQYCMRVVGHRGGGYDYPENSLSAFQNCKDKGCSAVEFDLALTKDKVPIIFHDDTIERLTGQLGIINQMTWDELKNLDISARHPLRDKFNGHEKIALFDETIDKCLKNNLRVFIDVKENNLEIVQIILDAYKKYPELYKKSIVTSFYPLIIYMLRKRNSKIIGSLSYRPKFFSSITWSGSDGPGESRSNNIFKHLSNCFIDYVYDWALARFVYNIIGISTILLHKDVVNLQVINNWKNLGVRVIAWSINLPSEKLLYSKVYKITYFTDTLLTEKS